MNTNTLLWLSALSGGFASAIAAYATLIAILGRIRWTHARVALRTARFVGKARSQKTAWLHYASPILGLALSVKAIWDGAWILALGCIAVGMLCWDPVRVFFGARKAKADAEVADFALICMAHVRREKTILQTLQEASVTLNDSDVRKTIAHALERFYNGASESEVLEHLLAEHSNGDWTLLVWALLERERGDSNAELGATVNALMRRRLRLRKHLQPAYHMIRRSVSLALILGGALASFLILTPASEYYSGSLQGQAVGVALLSVWFWITKIWTAQLQSMETMLE